MSKKIIAAALFSTFLAGAASAQTSPDASMMTPDPVMQDQMPMQPATTVEPGVNVETKSSFMRDDVQNIAPAPHSGDNSPGTATVITPLNYGSVDDVQPNDMQRMDQMQPMDNMDNRVFDYFRNRSDADTL